LKDTETLVGQTIGNYRIIKCLGKGGMGAVYHAEHPEIESKVAIKVLLPRFVSAPDIVKRFFDEARAVNRIGHPGIVRIHDCNEHEGVGVYLVMELLEGETVAERFESQGKLTIDVVVRLMQQVASALDASHKTGIVHRDLKPANIFIVPDPDIQGGERVKILDFGIAKLVEEHGSIKSDTETGAIIGSPLYMSPEQCIDSKNVDHRTDIYSLGAIAYRLLSGEFPYEADTLGKLIIKHYKEKARPISELVPDLPPDLEWVIEQALEVDRKDRFQSMAGLREAVQEAMEVTEVELIDELELEGWRDAPVEVVELKPPPAPPAPKTLEERIEEKVERKESSPPAKPPSPPVKKAAPPAKPPPRIARAVSDEEDDPPGLAGSKEEPKPRKPKPRKPKPESSGKDLSLVGGQTTLSGSSGEQTDVHEAIDTGGGRGLLIAGVVAAMLGVAVAVVMVSHYGGAGPGPAATAASPPPAVVAPPARPTPATVTIKLVLTPPDAAVKLDGEPVTSLPEVVLEGGARRQRLEVSAEGYETEVREVGAHSAAVLEIALKKKKKAGGR